MNAGFVVEGFPSAGAWLTYALGSAKDNLSAYVAIPDILGNPPAGVAENPATIHDFGAAVLDILGRRITVHGHVIREMLA